MKLLWVIDGPFEIGAANGFSIHRFKMRAALAALGVEITTDRSATVDAAVHVIRPDYFTPVPGKLNICFTACEMTRPTVHLLNPPDLLVVPCQHNKQVFGLEFSGPCEVCPEGVSPEKFPFFQRKPPGPGEPFRFLYFGNDFFGNRKGAWLAFDAWKTWLKSGSMPPNVELYFKTSEFIGPVVQRWQATGSGPDAEFEDVRPLPEKPSYPAQVFDCRYLQADELLKLFNSAHAFVFPSCGEGWGLTLTEAMATGLPCTWTHSSAPLDYADETIGFPITDFKMIPFWKEERPLGVGEPDYYGAAAETPAIIERMEEIYNDYPRALEIGRAASERMHSKYTWAQAAQRFIQIVEKYI